MNPSRNFLHFYNSVYTQGQSTCFQHLLQIAGGPGKSNSIIYNGKRLTDAKEIADALNEGLIDKVRKHAESIPKSNINPLEFTRKQLANKHVPEVDLLKWVEYDEVNDVIKGLKNSDATGPDGLTSQTLKKLRPILRPQLHSITNKCFQNTYHQRSWKPSKCLLY